MSKSVPPSGGAGNEPGAVAEVDIDAQLKKTLEILQKEVIWLDRQSSLGKLDTACSRDLVAYVKLLSELQASEKDWLKDVSDDELEKLLKDRSAKG